MSFKFSFKPDSDDEHESNGMQLDNHDAGVGQSNGEEKSERTGVVAAVEVVADQVSLLNFCDLTWPRTHQILSFLSF